MTSGYFRECVIGSPPLELTSPWTLQQCLCQVNWERSSPLTLPVRRLLQMNFELSYTGSWQLVDINARCEKGSPCITIGDYNRVGAYFHDTTTVPAVIFEGQYLSYRRFSITDFTVCFLQGSPHV